MATSQSNRLVQHLRRFVFLRDAVGLPDQKLLELFISRQDEVAFEALVRRHGAMVMGVCRRILGSYHDAEDAFQATFLVLSRKAAGLAARELVANWLYGVAYNTALRAKAAAARRHKYEREKTVMAEPEAPTSGLGQDLLEHLDRELNRLPDKYRAAVVLCDLEGKSRKEAAEQIGCPEGTVASRLGRGRSMLAKRLSQRGVALAATALAGDTSLNIAAASLSPSLIAATTNAATLYATGLAMTSIVSSNVLALADRVLKAMILTKIKTMAVATILVGVAVFGGGGMLTLRTVASPLGDETLPAVVSQPNGNTLPAAKRKDTFFPNFQYRFEPMRSQNLERSGGTKESEDAVALGLAWLARHQENDGRWKLDGRFPDKGNANDAAGTALGLLPFLGAGKTHKLDKDNPYKLVVDKSLRYLLAIQSSKTGNNARDSLRGGLGGDAGGVTGGALGGAGGGIGGGIGGAAGAPPRNSFSRDMYAHGLCTIAICEAYGMTKDANLKKSAQAAIDFIVAAQHEAGGWRYSPGQVGDTCVTGWQVTALKAAEMAGLEVPAATFHKAQNYLDNAALHPQTDGYRYTSEGQPSKTMTAVALRCRQLLQGWEAQNPRLIKAVGGYITPNFPKAEVKDVYFNYYATQVMHAFGGAAWKNWNNKNRDLLIQAQNTEDAKPEVWGSWSPVGDQWGQTGGRLMMTSFNLLSLEVYYRYPITRLPEKQQNESAPKPIVPEPPKLQEPSAPKASLEPKRILEEAIEWSDRIDAETRPVPSMHWSLIGAEQIKIGERKAAEESFRRASQSNSGLLVAFIASHQAQAGEFEMALKTAELLKESPRERGFALSFIAAAQARTGNVTAALASVAAIDKETHADIPTVAFEAIAEAQLRSGDIKLAIETANSISRLDLRVKHLVNISVIRHLAGKDDSREILDRALTAVKDSNEKDGPVIGSAQGYIAQALAQMGRFPEAFQLASRLLEPWQHYAQGAIAIEQANAKDFAGAVKTARSIKQVIDVARDRALKEIAILQPDDDAFAALNEIEYDYFQAEGLVAIAKRQVAAGRKQHAAETFRKANEAALRAIDPPGMAQVKKAALSDLARAQGETGFGAAARIWIDRLEIPEERVMALIGLAQGLAAERAKR